MAFCKLKDDPGSNLGLICGKEEGSSSYHDSAIERRNDKDADTLIARDRNAISFIQRQKVYEEMHGIIAPTADETEELVLCSLNMMQAKIDAIAHKPAYELAFQQNPQYVMSRGFRLMFLRAENFHVVKAAERLVRFFEGKLRLFGRKSLGRSLEMDRDLDTDDQAALKSGVYQVLKSRDTAGRLVLCSLLDMMPEKCYQHAVNMVCLSIRSSMYPCATTSCSGFVFGSLLTTLWFL